MMLPDYFEFSLPSRVIAGRGLLDSMAAEIEALGVTKGMVVTDKVLQEAGVVRRVLDALGSSSLEIAYVFDEVPPDSDTEIVQKGAELAREHGVDFLLAIGGGSSMDTAKGINIVYTLGGNILDHQGAGVVAAPLALKLVAIPTTSGTGSEVTGVAVIKDRAQNLKLSYPSPFLTPNLSILIPELTLSMSPRLTAATGMDALTHAVEAYLSTNADPFSDGLALHAIKIICQHLPAATHNGQDLEARYQMQVGACIAGASFTYPLVGVVHASAHAAGGVHGLHHGLGCSIMLPYGMEFNLEVSPERYRDIAQAMGIDVRGLSGEEAGWKAIEKVWRLAKDCGLPTNLKDAGVPQEAIHIIAEVALTDGAMVTNPRPAELEDLQQLMQQAYEGALDQKFA
ncbi:MAG: iron-containing alcohol dehydrogenase [Clostridia bacterium]|nr:iron-containing alcohol dehydrogenase [Clostridia bacterium]